MSQAPVYIRSYTWAIDIPHQCLDTKLGVIYFWCGLEVLQLSLTVAVAAVNEHKLQHRPHQESSVANASAIDGPQVDV